MKALKRISNNSIQKLGFKAGVKSLDSIAYESVRGILKSKMDNILRIANVYRMHSKKRTINESMISTAAADVGMPKQFLTHKLRQGVLCESYETKSSKKRNSPKKKKFKPGVVSKRKVQYYQKLHSCLILNKSAIKDLAKKLIDDYYRDYRFSCDSLTLLQYIMENYIIGILKKAKQLASRAGNSRVSHKDVELAYKM